MKDIVELSKTIRDAFESCRTCSEHKMTNDEAWWMLHGFSLALHGVIMKHYEDSELTHDDIQIILTCDIIPLDDDCLDAMITEIWKEFLH
jgi:hypothetical protein